ncbi:hypothetical protein F5887DRAFT_935393, partial [Amanita rubescens]
KLLLFDVDGTLTPVPGGISSTYTLRALRKQFMTGFVGGSDMVKISEQLSVGGSDGAVHHLDSR